MGAVGLPISPWATSDIFGNSRDRSSTVEAPSKTLTNAGARSNRYSRLPRVPSRRNFSLKNASTGADCVTTPLKARGLHHGELGGPVAPETDAVDGEARAVHARIGGHHVEDGREHPLGRRADLDRRLARTGSVDRDEADALGEQGGVGLRHRLLAAVEAADREHDRHGRVALGQAQVAHDLLALERQADDLQGRGPAACRAPGRPRAPSRKPPACPATTASAIARSSRGATPGPSRDPSPPGWSRHGRHRRRCRRPRSSRPPSRRARGS